MCAGILPRTLVAANCNDDEHATIIQHIFDEKQRFKLN